MEPGVLAQYYYDNYDRWFRHVRLPRKRCWPPYPVLNIPNDTDSEVAVQNAAGTIIIHAEKIDEANRGRYIMGALDWEVGEYWRRRGRQPSGSLPDEEIPAPTPRAPAPDPEILEGRLRTALERAKAEMTIPERCAFGAYWKARGDRKRAQRIFRAAQSESTNYDMARHRAIRRIKEKLMDEFSPGEWQAPNEDFPPAEGADFLIEVGAEFLTELGVERVYELVYDIFCRDLPEVPD
jgi:hypothetical protein